MEVPLEIVEYHREGYLISTDPSRLNLEFIHRFLSQESYWAAGRSMEVVNKMERIQPNPPTKHSFPT